MNKKILVVGDVILDRYIIGETNRISPEAPVPIVKVEDEKYVLGGAANVANNIVNLGVDVHLLGGIGKDVYGSKVKELLVSKGIKELLLDHGRETTTKTRVLSRNQQMMRIDRESRFTHNADFKDKITSYLDGLLFDMIVISDYNKGFVTKELVGFLKHLNVKIVVDPKTTNWHIFKDCFLVKPNLLELRDYVGTHLEDTFDEIVKHTSKIVRKLNIENLVVTRGSKGMILSNKTSSYKFPTKVVEVYDVTGAGDTAISVLAYELCQGSALNMAIKYANAASAFVVTKSLTYAISKNEYQDLIV